MSWSPIAVQAIGALGMVRAHFVLQARWVRDGRR